GWGEVSLFSFRLCFSLATSHLSSRATAIASAITSVDDIKWRKAPKKLMPVSAAPSQNGFFP
ncbi:MAG: hypothetical protein ACRD37_03820, partial [Candidatus Acidiferrales bacterium]